GCAITIFGDVAGKPLGRRGAKPGDKIYVSKALGASAAGLEWLMANRHCEEHSDVAIQHLYPTPELELGQKLVNHATACMDISDGLAKDLHRLCKASKVGAELHHVPCYKDVSLEHALYGGEDYALLFTAPKSRFGIEIGEITKGPALEHNGQPLENKGYDHFSVFS
ncbi:MAG: thiamine-phosphate kinase, partial [Deltaproteobacteria bacterium]|nr:thiamine-phosphate kinase [Deltaproteobacteria bacterium]